MISEDDDMIRNPDWDDEHLQRYLKTGHASHDDLGHGDKCAWCNEAVSKGIEARMGLTTHLKMGMLENKFRKRHGSAIEE